MEYDNHLSPKGHALTPTPKSPNQMALTAGMAAAASGESSDHEPDHLLTEKTKPSPEDEDEDEEEDSETDSSVTESVGSDTYDASLSVESNGRGNKELMDRLQKELLNEKQRNQQMETELVAMKRERDFALSELEEMRQQRKKQKGN